MTTRARRATSLASIVDGQAADQESRIQSRRNIEAELIGWYWVPDDHECYVAGKLLSETDASKTLASGKTTTVKMLTVELQSSAASKEQRSCPKQECFPILDSELIAASEAAKVSDLAKMMEVSTGSTLHVLRSRFQVDEIYTNMGQILIALNPFKAIEGMYTEQKMWDIHRKKGADMADLPPHVYSVGNSALYGLKQDQNQVLIISGESGAGKTETTKRALEFIVAVSRESGSGGGGGSGARAAEGAKLDLPRKILSASPLLEAMGNAKTLRNDNSSRFGKYMVVFFDDSFGVCGAWNEVYLLEKSRITQPEAGERSYHIFYQLLYGGSESDKQKFRFDGMKGGFDLSFLSHADKASCFEVAGCDEQVALSEVERSISSLGISPEERDGIFRLVAAVQHLGNIQIEATADGEASAVVQDDRSGPLGNRLERACAMLGLEAVALCEALTSITLRAGSGARASMSKKKFKLAEAIDVRNALAKELYNALFLWTVQRVNQQLLTVPRTEREIGVLDIFGFEIFPVNSFEQLCINLTNERLQNNFNRNVFQLEMDLYKAEGIDVDDVRYKDNQPVIDLICSKGVGLLPMLDEEVRVPNGSDKNFQAKFLKKNAKHQCLKPARNQTGPFTVVHFAGPVTYESTGLLKKNRNNFSDDMQALLGASSDSFVLQVLSLANAVPQDTPESSPTSSSPRMRSRSASSPKGASNKKPTVSSGFRVQLDSLMQKLDSSAPHYIRCIKSNGDKAMGMYEPRMVFEQLTYSGVFEAVVIQQQGYPIRLQHADFRGRFHMLHGRNEGNTGAVERRIDDTDGNAYTRKEFESFYEGSTAEWDEAALAVPKVHLQTLHFGDTILDECKALVEDAQQKWPDMAANSIVIGKSLVLYKPAVYYKLEHEKRLVEEPAHLECQRISRGAMARNMRRSVLVAVKAIGTTAMENGSLAEIQKAVTDMRAVTEQWLKLFPTMGVLAKVTAAAEQLLGYVKTESEVVARMKTSMGQMASSAVLAELEDVLKIHGGLEIDVAFPLSGPVQLKGVRDSALVKSAEERKDAVGLAVDIEEHFKVGFQMSDSSLLGKALELMKSPALVGGVVVPADFCGENARKAKASITRWKDEETRIMSKVQDCLKRDKGALKDVKQSPTTVDSKELRAVLKTLGTPVVTGGITYLRGKILPATGAYYIRAVTLLADCREGVQGIQLDNVKRLMEREWDEGAAGDGTEQGIGAGSANVDCVRRDLPSLVSEIDLIRKYMYISLVQTEVKTALTAGALRGPVPMQVDATEEKAAKTAAKTRRKSSIITAATARSNIGRVHRYVAELKRCIAAFDEYVESLPPEALQWIQVAKEIYAVRVAMIDKDWSALKTATEDAHTAASFATTQNEIKLAKDEVIYHELLSSMVAEIVLGAQWAVDSEVGDTEPTSLRLEAQDNLTEASRYSDFESDDWSKTFSILKALVDLRNTVRNKGWGAVLADVEAVFTDGIVPREIINLSADPSRIDKMAAAAQVEFLRIEDEAHEDNLLTAFKEAMQSNNAEGRVGALKVANMNTIKLDECLKIVTQRQQKSRRGADHVFTLRTLRIARNRFVSGTWWSLPEEVNDSIMERLHSNTNWDQALTTANREIDLLVKEAMHRVVMRDLNDMLGTGAVTGSPSRIDATETSAQLTQMRRTVETSDEQMESHCGCPENQSLMKICKVVLGIRRNAVEDRWNPAFDKIYGCVSSKDLIGAVWRNSLAMDESGEKRQELIGGGSPGVATLLLEFKRLGVTESATAHFVALKKELALLDGEVRDRAFRITLTEAIAQGRVRGNVEDVDYSIIDTAKLDTVVQAAEKFGNQASDIVKSLLSTAKVLLSARRALVEHEPVNAIELKAAMDKCYFGIGHDEMELIVDESRNWQVLTKFNHLLDSDAGRTSGAISTLELISPENLDELNATVTDAEQDLPTGKMAERMLVVASQLLEMHQCLKDWTASKFAESKEGELETKVNELMDSAGFQPCDEVGDVVVTSRTGRSYQVVDSVAAGEHSDGIYEVEFREQMLGLGFEHEEGTHPSVSEKPDTLVLPRIGDYIFSVGGEEVVATDPEVDPFDHMAEMLGNASRPVFISFTAKSRVIPHARLVAEGDEAAFNAGLNKVWDELCLIDNELLYRRMLRDLSAALVDKGTAIVGTPGNLSLDHVSATTLEELLGTIRARITSAIPTELEQLMSSANHSAMLRKLVKAAPAPEDIHKDKELASALRSQPFENLHVGTREEAVLLSKHCDHDALRVDLINALARLSTADPSSSENAIPDAQSIRDLDRLLRQSRKLSRQFEFTDDLSTTIDVAVSILALRRALTRGDFDAFAPNWNPQRSSDADWVAAAKIVWVDDEVDNADTPQPQHSVQAAVRAALLFPADALSIVNEEVSAARDIVDRRLIESEIKRALESGKLAGDLSTGQITRAEVSSAALAEALKLADSLPRPPFSSALIRANNMKNSATKVRRSSTSSLPENVDSDDSIEHLVRSASRVYVLRQKYEEAVSSKYPKGFEPIFISLCTMFQVLDMPGLVSAIQDSHKDHRNEQTHTSARTEFSLMLDDIRDAILRERMITAAGNCKGDADPVGTFQKESLHTDALSEARDNLGALEATTPNTSAAQKLVVAVSQLHDMLRKKAWAEMREILPAAKEMCTSYSSQDGNSYENEAMGRLGQHISRLAQEADFFHLVSALNGALKSSGLEMDNKWSLTARAGSEDMLEKVTEESLRTWQLEAHECQLLDGWAVATHPRKFSAGIYTLARSACAMRSAALALEAELDVSGVRAAFLPATLTEAEYLKVVKSEDDVRPHKRGQVIEKMENLDDAWDRLHELEKAIQSVEKILRVCGDLDGIPLEVIDEVKRVRASVDVRSCCLGVAEFLALSTQHDEGAGSSISFSNFERFVRNISTHVAKLTATGDFQDLVRIWEDMSTMVHYTREHRATDSLEEEYEQLQDFWAMQVPQCTVPWVYWTMKEVDVMRLQESCRAALSTLEFPGALDRKVGVLGWSFTPSAGLLFSRCLHLETFEEFLSDIEGDDLSGYPSVAPLVLVLQNTVELVRATSQLTKISVVEEDASREDLVITLSEECTESLKGLASCDRALAVGLKREYMLVKSEASDRKMVVTLGNALRQGRAAGDTGAVDISTLDTKALLEAIQTYTSISVPVSSFAKCLLETAQMVLTMRQGFYENPSKCGKALTAAQTAVRQNQQLDKPGICTYFWPEAAIEVQLYSDHVDFLLVHEKLKDALTHGRCDLAKTQISVDKLDNVIVELQNAVGTASVLGARMLEFAESMRAVRYEIFEYKFSITDRHDTEALCAAFDNLMRLKALEKSDLEARPHLIPVLGQDIVLSEFTAVERFIKGHEASSRLIRALEVENPLFADDHYPIVIRETIQTTDLLDSHAILREDIVHDEALLLDSCAEAILELRHALDNDAVYASDDCLRRIEAKYFPIEENLQLKRWPQQAQEELVSGIKSLYNYHTANMLEREMAQKVFQDEDGSLVIPKGGGIGKLPLAIERAEKIPMHYRCDKVEGLRESAVIILSVREAVSSGEWQLVNDTAKMAWCFEEHVPVEDIILDELQLLEEYAESRIIIDRAKDAILFGRLDGSFDSLNYDDVGFTHLVEVEKSLNAKREDLKILHKDGVIALELEKYNRTCDMCCCLRQAVLRGGWIIDDNGSKDGQDKHDVWLPVAGASMNLGWGEFSDTRLVEELAEEVQNNGGIGFYVDEARLELLLAQKCLEHKLLIFHLRQELSIDGPEGDPGSLDPKSMSTEHLQKVVDYEHPELLRHLEVQFLRRDAKIIIGLRQAVIDGDWALLGARLDACDAIIDEPGLHPNLLALFDGQHDHGGTLGGESDFSEIARNEKSIDSDVKSCPLCGTKYSLTNHQRICGYSQRLCCDRCSSKRRILPGSKDAYAVRICDDSANVVDHTYEVVFTKEKLLLTFEHDASDFPIVKVNGNEDMPLPAPNDMVVAVNGKLLEESADAFSMMAGLIQSVPRPVTLKFRRPIESLPTVEGEVAAAHHEPICSSARQEIQFYREFMHYNVMVYELHAALAMGGSADLGWEKIKTEPLKKALVHSMILKTESPEILHIQHVATLIIQLRDLVRLGDTASALRLVDELEEAFHKKVVSDQTAPSYITFAMDELRAMRGAHYNQRIKVDLIAICKEGQIDGVAGALDTSRVSLEDMNAAIRSAQPELYEGKPRFVVDESCKDLLCIVEVLLELRKVTIQEDWDAVESVLVDFDRESELTERKAKNPHAFRMEPEAELIRSEVYRVRALEQLCEAQDEGLPTDVLNLVGAAPTPTRGGNDSLSSIVEGDYSPTDSSEESEEEDSQSSTNSSKSEESEEEDEDEDEDEDDEDEDEGEDEGEGEDEDEDEDEESADQIPSPMLKSSLMGLFGGPSSLGMAPIVEKRRVKAKAPKPKKPSVENPRKKSPSSKPVDMVAEAPRPVLRAPQLRQATAFNRQSIHGKKAVSRRESRVVRQQSADKPLDVDSIDISALDSAMQYVKDKNCLTLDVQHQYSVVLQLKSLRTEVKAFQWLRVKEILEQMKAMDHLRPMVLHELRLVEAAMNYRQIVVDLTRALDTGKASGEVGKLEIMSIDVEDLHKCIRFVKKHFINHPDIRKLHSASCLIRDVRLAMKKSRWFSTAEYQSYVKAARGTAVQAAIPGKRLVQARQSLNRLVQTDDTVMSCVKRGKTTELSTGAAQELMVAEQELKDRIVSLELINGLVEPDFLRQASGSTDFSTMDDSELDMYNDVDVMTSDVTRLQTAIETAGFLVPTTQGARVLYATAKVLFPIRKAYMAHDWDELVRALDKSIEQRSNLSTSYGAKELRFYESQLLRKRMFWKDVMAELDHGQVKWDAEKRDLSLGDIHHSIFELNLRLQRVNKRTTNHGDIYPIADGILKVRRALVTGSLDDIEEQLNLLLTEKYSFDDVPGALKEANDVCRWTFIQVATKKLKEAVTTDRSYGLPGEGWCSTDRLEAAIEFVQHPPVPYAAVQAQHLDLTGMPSSFSRLYVCAILLHRLRLAVLDENFGSNVMLNGQLSIFCEAVREVDTFTACLAAMHFGDAIVQPSDGSTAKQQWGKLKSFTKVVGKFNVMPVTAQRRRESMKQDLASARSSARRASMAISKSIRATINTAQKEDVSRTIVFGREDEILEEQCAANIEVWQRHKPCATLTSVLLVLTYIGQVDKDCLLEVERAKSDLVNRVAMVWLDRAIRHGMKPTVHPDEFEVFLKEQQHGQGAAGVSSVLDAELKKISALVALLADGNFTLQDKVRDRMDAATFLMKLRAALGKKDWSETSKILRDLSTLQKKGTMTEVIAEEIDCARHIHEAYTTMQHLRGALADLNRIIYGDAVVLDHMEVLSARADALLKGTALVSVDGPGGAAIKSVELTSLIECIKLVQRLRVAVSIDNVRDICQIFSEGKDSEHLQACDEVQTYWATKKEDAVVLCLQRMLAVAATHQTFALAELRLGFGVLEDIDAGLLAETRIKRLMEAAEVLQTGKLVANDAESRSEGVLDFLSDQRDPKIREALVVAARTMEGKMLGERLRLCLKTFHDAAVGAVGAEEDASGSEEKKDKSGSKTEQLLVAMSSIRDIVASYSVGYADPDVYPSVLLLIARALLLLPAQSVDLVPGLGQKVGRVADSMDWVSTGVILQLIITHLEAIDDEFEQQRCFGELTKAADDFAKHAGALESQHERRVQSIRRIIGNRSGGGSGGMKASGRPRLGLLEQKQRN